MAVADLLADLAQAGIELVAQGDRLRYRPRSAVTPDLVERLKAHKAEILAALLAGGRPEADNADAIIEDHALEEGRPEAAGEPIRWEDCIEPPEPCPDCGGLLYWWNPLGGRRCLRCDPPTTAIRLIERAESIRRRDGIPSPRGAAEMLVRLKQIAGT